MMAIAISLSLYQNRKFVKITWVYLNDSQLKCDNQCARAHVSIQAYAWENADEKKDEQFCYDKLNKSSDP